MKTYPVTTRVDGETKGRLQAIAEATDRSEAYLVRAAIESFVDVNAWQVAEIKRGLKAMESDALAATHEDVEAWVTSWNTKAERSRPKVRPRR